MTIDYDQLALEVAIRIGLVSEFGTLTSGDVKAFAKAYRKALKEKMEPVAWRCESKLTGFVTLTSHMPGDIVEPDKFDIAPLCTYPPDAQAEIERMTKLLERCQTWHADEMEENRELRQQLAEREGWQLVGYMDGRSRFFYKDDPLMKKYHAGMREVFAAAPKPGDIE